MHARIARLGWDELTDLIAGIEACGQIPADELNRIASLPDDDYHLARHAYRLAAGFARRAAEQQQQQEAA
jgi:hypothetical protein